ncbi:MAG: 6-hydroxymethylpterin diphosphokinase MptE-like protein [Candidatus Altiarchaeota archaeon]
MPWSHKYLEVVRSLDLDLAQDKKATLLLDRMIQGRDVKPLFELVRGRPVMVFGCGPSLENDLNKVFDAGILGRFVLLAVDGAVKALLQYGSVPHINVTDLDGDIPSIIRANELGCITMVHAHSANIKALLAIMPHLKGVVYGTTHSDPTGNVHNFGGFTDGDRAVHIAAHFEPGFIVLAGMDFGHVIGVFSGTYDPVKKPRGLRIGKMLLEDFAAHSRVRMFNLTSGGENIHHVPPITIDRLKHIV